MADPFAGLASPVEQGDPFAGFASPVQQQAPGLFDRIGAKYDNRMQEVDAAQQAYNRGEQGLAQGVIQKIGQGGFGVAYDTLGEAAGMLPDFVKAPFKYAGEKFGELAADPRNPIGLASMLGGVGYRQATADDPNLKRTVDSFGLIASGLPLGRVAEGAGGLAGKALANLDNVGMGREFGKTAGGYIDTRVKGANARGIEGLDKTSAALHDEAAPLYKAVDASGGAINKNGIALAKQRIEAKVGEFDDLDAPKTTARLDRMNKELQDGTIGVARLDKYRRKFSQIANDERKEGRLTADGTAAVSAIKGIDESLGSLGQEHFSVGGPEVVRTLEQARATSARAQSFDRIARIVKKTDGDPQRIKAAVNKMIADKKTQGLKPDEIKALKEAGSRSLAEYAERGLGTFGLDFGNRKNVAFPSIVGALSGGTVAAGMASTLAPVAGAIAGGTVARQLNKFAARGGLENVLQKIEGRKFTPKEISQLPPKEAIRILNEQETPITRDVAVKTKSNSAVPSDKLHQFIRQSGGINDTGELKGMGFSGLTRNQGKAAADMLDSVVEAGFLPEGATVDDLYNAIGDKKQHYKTYSDNPEGAVKAEMRSIDKLKNDPAYIEFQAGQIGVDTKGLTTRQIKAAIDKRMKELENDIPF